jgi:pimeloyl-ACP methyl ester carboxylesterase
MTNPRRMLLDPGNDLRMIDRVLQLADGRVAGLIDFGPAGGTAVLWCHGGPGSRFEPAPLVKAATADGLRLVGMDRPGYGTSTPLPGRTIARWVPDVVAIADHLAIDRFLAVGVSTGGHTPLLSLQRSPDACWVWWRAAP